MEVMISNALLEPRYTASEAARILDVGQGFVSYWIRSAHGRTRASFVDLIEMHMGHALLEAGYGKRRGLRAKIREAAETDEDPFAMARRSFLVEKGALAIRLSEGAAMDLGTHGQLVLETVIQDWATKIDFDADGLAARLWPDGRGSGIVVDPLRAFGKPSIPNTRWSTRDVVDVWRAEGCDASAVANLYALEPADVVAALRFEGLEAQAA